MCHSQGQCPGRGQRPDCPNLSVLINCVGISAHVRQCTHCSSELVCICQKYNHMPVNVPCGIIFHMVLCRKYRCTKNIQPRTAAHPGPTQLACSLRSHAYIHAEMTLQSQGACAEMDRLQKFHPSSLLRWGRDAAALISEGSQGNSRPCGQELCGHREARADILPNSTKIPPAPGALLFFFPVHPHMDAVTALWSTHHFWSQTRFQQLPRPSFTRTHARLCVCVCTQTASHAHVHLHACTAPHTHPPRLCAPLHARVCTRDVPVPLLLHVRPRARTAPRTTCACTHARTQRTRPSPRGTRTLLPAHACAHLRARRQVSARAPPLPSARGGRTGGRAHASPFPPPPPRLSWAGIRPRPMTALTPPGCHSDGPGCRSRTCACATAPGPSPSVPPPPPLNTHTPGGR